MRARHAAAVRQLALALAVLVRGGLASFADPCVRDGASRVGLVGDDQRAAWTPLDAPVMKIIKLFVPRKE